MCQLKSLLYYNLFAVIGTIVSGQDDFGGGEDAGGAEMDESSLGLDSAGVAGPGGSTADETFKIKSIFEESLAALQQLGFIIGMTKIICGKRKSRLFHQSKQDF